jgi:ribosomal protein S16
MLKIRLARTWKQWTPTFRVVLTEHTAPSKTWYKEVLWNYNAITKAFTITDEKKIKQLLSNGVQLTPRVEKLMKLANISL